MGCWEQNLGPVQERSVLLTTELSFQPNFWVLSSKGGYAERMVLSFTIDELTKESVFRDDGRGSIAL